MANPSWDAPSCYGHTSCAAAIEELLRPLALLLVDLAATDAAAPDRHYGSLARWNVTKPIPG